MKEGTIMGSSKLQPAVVGLRRGKHPNAKLQNSNFKTSKNGEKENDAAVQDGASQDRSHL